MKYNFPKIDLHLHLDGSFRISTLWELVQQQQVEVPANSQEELEIWFKQHSNSKNVNEFLEMFDQPLKVLQDKVSITRFTYELIEDIAKQGLVYAEIRFAPQLHCQKGLTQDDAIQAVLEGRKQALEKYSNIKIGIICCMMCQGPETVNWEANMQTAKIVHKYLDKGVVAIDLAGGEGFVPLKNFGPLFRVAKDLGTPIICHAGDSQDWHTVKDAIDFGAVRIGHGHHIYENPELCRYAADHNIALEICPTSNIQCKSRESYALHPAQNLFEMGIPVTINTDNMLMSRVTLDDEYDHCINEMGFEYEDLILMNINSAKVSFMKPEEKVEVIKKLEESLDQYCRA